MYDDTFSHTADLRGRGYYASLRACVWLMDDRSNSRAHTLQLFSDVFMWPAHWCCLRADPQRGVAEAISSGSPYKLFIHVLGCSVAVWVSHSLVTLSRHSHSFVGELVTKETVTLSGPKSHSP